MDRISFSPLIIQNAGFLAALASTKSVDRIRHMLDVATQDELFALVEICYNVAHSNKLKLTKRQMDRLVPHVEQVRRMSKMSEENEIKKGLVQTGGGLPAEFFAAILTPILLKLTRHEVSI